MIITSIINFIIALILNPMNLLVYEFKHLKFSLTLFYGSLTMVSNMLWSHEIIRFLTQNKFNGKMFICGLSISLYITFMMRQQLFVNNVHYLKRMISHHSTALTTSYKILETSRNQEVRKLAHDIIVTQKKEIKDMERLINKIERNN